MRTETPCKIKELGKRRKDYYTFNEEEKLFFCNYIKPYEFSINTIQILQKLFTAADFIQNYSPSVDSQIAYLKLFFSPDEVPHYIDLVIEESYKIIKQISDNQKK